MRRWIALLLPSMAMADVSVTVTPGEGVTVYRSTSILFRDVTDEQACRMAAEADTEARKVGGNYRCQPEPLRLTTRWTPAPTPIACAVSDWEPWQDGMTSACTGGMIMSSQSRLRTVTRPAANGGAACPALTETREVHKVCGTAPVKLPLPPRGTEVYSTLRVGARNEDVIERQGQYGQFRVPCAYSHMAYDDPIVFPGQPGASHLHMFFGNTSTDAATTTETLAKGNSTCRGGTANRSGYWTPAVIDTGLGQIVIPTGTLTYYKDNGLTPASGPISEVPNGLKILAGNSPSNDKELTGWTGEQNAGTVRHHFECWATSLPNGHGGKFQHIPPCPVGGYIKFDLSFPQCWDGVNLDSDNHRSHMAYAGGTNPKRCPATHPVALMQIAFNIDLPVRQGHDTTKWRLSSDAYGMDKPGGYSAHGDVIVQWEPSVMREILNGCIRSGADCHAHMIGDNRAIF